jgi:hypothetical protein
MIIKTAALTTALITASALAAPFTYQGTLQDSGAPANGEYDLRFELYDSSVGGTQIGSTQVFENHQVTDGTFQVDLDFGDAFDGSNRYLLIEVRDGASGGVFTELFPRSPITTTPQAQHATTADTVLNPQWTEAPGILTYGDGNDRVFINRSDFITSSEYFGVHGNVPNFVGMYVSGPANSLPFYGYSVDDAISAYTYVDSSDSGWKLVNNSQIALISDADRNLTVIGDVNSDNVNTTAVTASSYNYSSAKTSYVSVMGDSFHSASNDSFTGSTGNGGTYIDNPGTGWLVAPIQLPHGATVTSVRAYFTDTNPTDDLSISLSRRTHGQSGFAFLASISTAGFNGSNLLATDNSISLATIDNNLFSYQVRVWSLGWDGSNNMQIESMVVEYTTTQPD